MRTDTPESARSLAGDPGGTFDSQDHMPLLIDADEAASELSLGARTLWSLTACRAIPSQRIGRSVRYSPAELRAWVTAGCPTEPGSADRVRKAVHREG